MKTPHWFLKHLSGCKCRKAKGKEIGVDSGTNKLRADKATKDQEIIELEQILGFSLTCGKA